MTSENIQLKAIEMYKKNLHFLSTKDEVLYNNIRLFESALELEEYIPRYELEYKESYFDIFDNSNNTYYYGQDSYVYSKEQVEKMNFNSSSNTFKTFYEQYYTESVMETIKNASITSSSEIGNAPIFNYIQNNLPHNSDMKNIYKCFIFGVGLGIHLNLIDKKIAAKKYLFIEPSLEVFRLSLFITDYEEIASSSDIHFAVALNESDFLNYVSLLSDETFLYDQYIKFFKFSQNCDIYINNIQNFLVSQKHILYSYDRAIESFSRTYTYMSEGFKYLELKDISLFDKPVLLLAAGPSLSANIDYVKKNKDKFIIVAVYVLLPYLEEEGIIPDIVTQYDQQDKVVMETILKVKDKSLFNNTIFLFASHVVDNLMNVFPKDNIYIFQALYKVKPNNGIMTSPSIGEITYGLLFHLGIKDIYFLGLDMALNKDGSTHISEHKDSAGFGMSDNTNIESISFRKSILKVKGNFEKEVNTLPLFNVSIIALNNMLKYVSSKHTKVYNLSSGAYFDNTTPMKFSDLNISDMESIDKKTFYIELQNKFSLISSRHLNNNDINYNTKKLEDAKSLLEKVKKFHSIKYSTADEFKKSIFKLFNDLIYIECKCEDLQDIILNFYKHNLPYIFHFMNLREINNPKKHIKKLNRLLFNQTIKLFNEYLDSIALINKKPKP